MEYNNPNDIWQHYRHDRDSQESDSMKIAVVCIMFIAALFLLLMLTGCKAQERIVTVPEIHTEHHWHTDTVKERDSTHTERETVIREVDSAAMAQYGIQMERNQRAWLVLQREMEQRLRELEHTAATSDTVRDSIPVPYPVVKEVPGKPNAVERLLIIVGVVALVALFLMMLVRLVKKELPI